MKRPGNLLRGCIALLILASGCGGGGGTGSGSDQERAITVTAESTLIGHGQSTVVRASIQGGSNPSVTWEATAGTIKSLGPTAASFTAPDTNAVVTITATSVKTPGLKGIIRVESAAPGVRLQASSNSLIICGETDLQATVIGFDDRRVTWAATGGTVSEYSPGVALYKAPEEGGTYAVTATSVADPSKSASVNIEVVVAPTVITGRVVAQSNGRAVRHVQIAFFDGDGNSLGVATTESDGSFGIEVPMTAKRFHVIPGSIPSAYFGVYRYGNLYYDSTVTDCTAPLPEVCGFPEVPLANDIVLVEKGIYPPPFPTGCG